MKTEMRRKRVNTGPLDNVTQYGSYKCNRNYSTPIAFLSNFTDFQLFANQQIKPK